MALLAERKVEVLVSESKQGAQRADNSGEDADPSLDIVGLFLGSAGVFLLGVFLLGVVGLGVVGLGVVGLVSCVIVPCGRKASCLIPNKLGDVQRQLKY